MTLELAAVGIGTGPGAALPVVSAVAAPGHPGIVAVETEQAPVLASLVAGGRMKPDTGQVLLDGHDDPAAVRRTFALVDTPGVAEPFPVMTLKQIVHEELAFADRRPSRSDAATVLDELDVTRWADTHVQRVPTDARVRLLAEPRAPAAGRDRTRHHRTRTARRRGRRLVRRRARHRAPRSDRRARHVEGRGRDGDRPARHDHRPRRRGGHHPRGSRGRDPDRGRPSGPPDRDLRHHRRNRSLETRS